jgi:predicted CxxxxCH...CXXCH cytochrome family protein
MVRGVKKFIVALTIVMLAIPALAEARAVHYFNCADCHRAVGASLNSLSGNNLCLKCHSRTGDSVSTNDDPPVSASPNGRFDDIDASNALGSHPNYNTVSATETSHMWAVMGEVNPAAGAQSPTINAARFNGQNNISRGKVVCNRCHNPHGLDADPTILKVANANDEMCTDCHLPWNVANPDAKETHPVGINYADFEADTARFKAASAIPSAPGDVRLVGGVKVSCTTCHGVHFTDSNSSTIDVYNSAMVGDGKLLRSDGPMRTGATRNGAAGTAQMRSNLCQACHTYQLHGKGDTGDYMIGCLDCHGGHSHNGGNPSDYVLNAETPDAVPIRANGAPAGTANVTFTVYNAAAVLADSRNVWADEASPGAAGYCEQCHGDINGLTGSATDHGIGEQGKCIDCHLHNSTGWTYSFQVDQNAATCGKCHGFPPYLGVRGDKGNDPDGAGPNPPLGTDGGYAWNYVDGPPADDNYATRSYYKDESKTGHKTHAGRDIDPNWYFVGSSGNENCQPCHGPDAGSTGHREPGVTGTFRTVPFGGAAQIPGGSAASYKIGNPGDATCSNIYCHTNGMPRTGDDGVTVTRTYAGGTSPVWVGTGATNLGGDGNGFGAFLDSDVRCQKCHGNDGPSGSNTLTSKGNTAAHLVHIEPPYSIACGACHKDTASDATTLAPGATDQENGGTHVNQLADVTYNSAYDLGNGTLGTPDAYGAVTGTCGSVYCHSNGAATPTYYTPDWDVATSGDCGTCHVADNTLNTGAHYTHVRTDSTAYPQLSCDTCHGAGAAAGTHGGHVDGTVNLASPTLCYDCHGYDAEGGEVEPVWTNLDSEDCATCHAGTACGTSFNGMTPPQFLYARGAGHNRLAASGNYPQSGNAPADADCESCHLSSSPNHWDGVRYTTSGLDADLMLRADAGFPGTYAGSEDVFCDNCHGAPDASHPEEASGTTGINTHQGKKCVACHNVHGTSNIQMIHALASDQQAADPDISGEFSGDVAFNSLTDFTSNAYDEDDGAAGAADENLGNNGDDICATCHSESVTDHNNKEGSDTQAPTGHHIGENCFTASCHKPHDDSTDAFKVGAGTYCNDCHGFPPDTVEGSTTAAEIGAHAVHNVRTTTLPSEDRTDCAVCHPGADLYTLDQGDDKNNGTGGRQNHGSGNRLANLTAQIGYNVSTQACTGACHASADTAGDWTDTAAAGLGGDGLDCDACHYYSGAGSPISSSHGEHLAAGKVCTDCHQLADGSTPTSGELTHVSPNPSTFTGPADDGAGFQNRATASQDEAAVDFTGGVTSYTFDDDGADNVPGNADDNTCGSPSPNGLGCHASGAPDWDNAIPATNAGCLECHTNTTDATVNPTSGLHGGPLTVTGNSHDGSFDDGAAGTADCITCHTSAPSSAHADGTLDASAPTIAIAGSVGFTDGATASCANTCHSAGANWSYLWSDTAKLATGAECDNCHGTFGNGWNAGTVHATYPTRGGAHGSTGSLSYPCTDCHAIGASTAVYTFTSGTADWNPVTGETSHHGDGILQMNGNGTNFSDAGATAGCAGIGCHGINATHDYAKSVPFAIDTPLLNGDPAQVSCSGCHGNDIGGTSKNNYWPDGIGGNAEDDAGVHQKHIEELALSVYGETVAQLLTDNGNGTADAKQKELCQYCHEVGDTDHGDPVNLPAETWATANDSNTAGQGFYEIWEAPRVDRDSADYDTTGNGSCYLSACHNDRATDAGATTYGWYDGNTSACAMCHIDVTADAAHTEHTGAQGTYGRAIDCSDCHDGATDWGTNSAPASGHIDGTYEVAGGTVIDGTVATYDMGVTDSCGTNACHNAGDGTGAPVQGTYAWGTDANGGGDDCGLCHAAAPTSSTHGQHIASSYVSGCENCHTAGSDGAHIAGSVSYNTVTIIANGGATPNVTCTNTCHDGATAEFDGAPGIGCTDCHAGTYVGGGAYQHASGLHAATAANVTKHDGTLAGGCEACHTAYGSEPATHMDGTWEADGASQSQGRFVSRTGMTYNEQAVNGSTCAGTGGLSACHSDGGNWARLWSTEANADYVTSPNPGQAVCKVCHGLYASIANSDGWRTGTVHATSGAAKGSGHTDANPNECEDCHGYDSAISHEDGFITMSGDTNAVLTTGEDYQLAWGNNATNPGWYCESCHNGDMGDDALNSGSHTFVDSSAFPSPTKVPTHEKIRYVDGVSAPEGGCTGCHGNAGTGGYWPDGSRGGIRVAGSSGPADHFGKHPEHVQAIGDQIAGGGPGSATIANKNATCDYCHSNPGGGGHNDAAAPANLHDGATTKFKRIIGAGDDSNGLVDQATLDKVTCNNIDCHFDMPTTPHWYDDIYPPAAVSLTAQPGPEPRSIEVKWLAPGDDDNVADTTAYVYDLRMSNSAISTNPEFSGATVVGGLPAAYKQNYNSVVVVENLDPLQTYHFSLKTKDTAGNWSTISPGDASATPTADTLAPDFGGADKALPGDESGTVHLSWTPAEDHTMPITYKVWMKAESAGTLVMGDGTGGTDAPILTGVTDNRISLTHNMTYYGQGPITVTDDTIYHFGVRACDGNGICDANTQSVSATPTDVSPVDKSFPTYKTDGNATLQVIAGDPAGPAVTGAALPRVFAPASNLTYDVDYFVDTFAITLKGSNSAASQVKVDVGYSTNGSDFTPLLDNSDPTPQPVTKTVEVAKRADRVFSFKIVNIPGVTVTSGQRLAIQLSEVTSNGVTASYGDATTRGDLTVAERIINDPPQPQANPGSASLPASSAVVDIQWDAYTDTVDGLSDTVHYDLYGSDDDGASYEYLIAIGLDAATTSYQWNTQVAGIESGPLAVLLKAGDTYTHATQAITGIGSADATDYVAPSAIDDLVARARPKAGSVWLTWTAPGDDLDNHGRADHYEVRYRTDVAVSDANWASSTPVSGAPPSPDFGGKIQNFEVVDLNPGTTYYFGVKTFDEAGKASAVSTAKTAGSDQEVGGPRCGMCHTTAPSVDESVGNHKLHGFTLYDCDKCHTQDAGATKPSTYGLDHQDGTLKMGFGPLGAFQGYISGNRIYYTSDGNPDSGTNVIYDDTNGFGGFGDGSYPTPGPGDGTDDGNCFRWGALGVGGCHGPAASDPDGGGTTPYRMYPTPNWNAQATLDCAACHGNSNRGATGPDLPDRVYDPYGREYDATNDNGGVTPDQILGAPAVDNHGKYDPAAATVAERKYIGQHEKHLNYSFRFSKGDSCNLCHEGEYADRDKLDGRHANGDIDVQLDPVGAGEEAYFTPNYNGVDTAGACFSLSDLACHPASTAEGGSAPVPKWDSGQNFDCVQCHGFDGTIPTHVTDPAGGVSAADNGWATDPMAGNCTYCHFGGHPLDDLGGTAIILPNSSQVGLEFRSGGIHMKKTIGGRSASYEAQICWNCHDANLISEWGADNSVGGGAANNTATDPGNGTNYNYGQIYTDATYTTPTSTWSTGYWKSAEANFDYKKDAIQSTHTTSETANAVNANNSVAPVGSPLSGSDFGYTEAPDADSLIRCSNCHDVHNRNKAPGDNPTGNPLLDGPPYLRGTWKRNPYKEDGAPWNKAYVVTNANFGAVPRAGGPGGNETGGYQIDQNNGSPTAGWSLATSAGICTLCHGTDVDKMDRYEPDGVTPEDGVNLWVGVNGHSNGVIGGTAKTGVATNIFGDGIGGRAVPSASAADGSASASDVYDMALQTILNQGSTAYGYGYRSLQSGTGKYTPPIIDKSKAYNDFYWGVTVDQTTIDIGYHAFSCSKCHNPHASRLPKLMITNCLDTTHNTWQNNRGSQQAFWNAGGNSTVYDVNEWTATHNTAQNCHRYDRGDNVGGWNKVTPW